jgi:hypothetical protein
MKRYVTKTKLDVNELVLDETTEPWVVLGKDCTFKIRGDVIDKLADYEDLEEQGRLLKLPCDKVYYIVDKNNPKYAAVMRKSIRDLTVYEIENIDIDGRYFSTEELAEAKLKELRGGENESSN